MSHMQWDLGSCCSAPAGAALCVHAQGEVGVADRRALGGCAVRREMFELIANAHVMRQSLQEAYVHPADVSARAPSPPSARNRCVNIGGSGCRPPHRPSGGGGACSLWRAVLIVRRCRACPQEGYIGADQNWEYLNRFIQPVSTSPQSRRLRACAFTASLRS